MEKKDVLKIVETLMSVPGMNDVVKIDLKMSRKNALLLSNVIESGLNVKEADRMVLIQAIPKDLLLEISQIAVECLEKSGLKEMSENLKQL